MPQDVLKPGHLVFGETGHTVHEIAYEPALLGDISRVLMNNLIFIGNLHALMQWYKHVRRIFMQGNPYSEACYEGALSRIKLMIEERVGRLAEFAAMMPRSLELAGKKNAAALPERPFAQQAELAKRWPELEPVLGPDRNTNESKAERDGFLAALEKAKKGPLHGSHQDPAA